jgi:catechol 2,3-dioxygenase-like lactoylglutathione lyase family enzyme
MIDHLSITVRDLSASAGFYDAIMGVLGHPRAAQSDCHIGYGVRTTAERDEGPYISVVQSKGSFSSDNRHWAFRAPTPAVVDAFHRAALANNGTCDGPPGRRPDYHLGYYAAFVRDPDGNRLEAVCHVC